MRNAAESRYDPVNRSGEKQMPSRWKFFVLDKMQGAAERDMKNFWLSRLRSENHGDICRCWNGWE